MVMEILNVVCCHTTVAFFTCFARVIFALHSKFYTYLFCMLSASVSTFLDRITSIGYFTKRIFIQDSEINLYVSH